jgi:hypothetical protein
MAETVVMRLLIQVVEQLLRALVELEATEELDPPLVEQQEEEVRAQYRDQRVSLAERVEAMAREEFFPHQMQHTAKVDKELFSRTDGLLKQAAPHITASLSLLSNPTNPSAGA